jgi:hypothetical protein
MSERQTGPAGLTGFRDRLTGGTGPAIQRGRPPGSGATDSEALRTWQSGAFAQLGDVRDDTWNAGQADAVISTLAGQLRENRRLLTAVLLAPDRVLDWRIGQYDPARGKALIDCWTEMCCLAEAAWQATAPDLPAAGGYAAGDAAFLRPAAARLRFLVLSEPMRWRGKDSAMWIKPDEVFGGSGALDRVLGKESWYLLIGRCREARTAWRTFLDAYQSHPVLSQAMPGELEQELRVLVLRGTRRLSAPLGLSVNPLSEPRPLTPEDKTLISDVIERHMLPRFDLVTVASVALFDYRPGWRAVRLTVCGAAVLAAVAALACAAALLGRPAAVAAVICYLLICAGVLVLPGEWGMMWLLRMPAAAAVGMVVLIPVLPTPPGGWAAVAVLAAASSGYLLIEVRNHGVSPGAACRRALLVAIIGAVHALMVALIGLVVVAPAFVPDGRGLRALWTHPGYGHAGTAVALAAAWCLSVGVFSQILWDDRPITAPLAHLSWRA